MRRSLALALAATAAVLFTTLLLTGPVQAADPAGQTVFMAQKCNMCHAVSALGIEAKMKAENMMGPDMTGTKERRDAEWLTKYLKQEVKVDDKPHKKEWKGTDAELTDLVAWLMQQ